MRRKALLAAVVLVLSACDESIFKGSVGGGGRGSKFAGSTKGSLGKLTKSEKRPEVLLRGESKPSIEAPRGQILVLLWFEGKSEIRFEALRAYSLVDKTGKEYPLYFAGTPTAQGALTCEGWQFENGGRLSMGGRWAYSGTAKLKEPGFVFLYAVPETAKELSLQVGDTLIPLPSEGAPPR